MVAASSRPNANRLKKYAQAFLVISLFFVSISFAGFRIPAYSIVPNANLTEWTVPTANSQPLGLSLDPSGKCCWFVEYFGNKVGHFDPNTNSFQEWNIPTAAANPSGLATTTISGSLAIWGTEFAKDKVFIFYPTTGTFLEYSLPNANSGVEYISVEPSGTSVRVWFTEIQRNADGELIYDSHTGAGTLYENTLPGAVGGGANGIFAGPGYVWFAGISALARWDRPTNQYTIWPLPTHGSATGRFLAFDSHGQPWYTQGVTAAGGTDNYVGVLRGDNTIREWQIPTAGSDPRVISLNPFTQNPWIAEQSSQANNGQVAELDPSAGGIVVPSGPTTAPSGGAPIGLTPGASPPATASSNIVMPVSTPLFGTPNGQFTEYPLGNSQPHDVIVDSSGNTWVIESGTNKIAKITPTAQDFGLSIPGGAVSIAQGGSGSVSIKGTSITSYSGSVTLAVISSPTGVSFSSFTPNPINIPSGGTASAVLVISVAGGAPLGPTVITISGTDGSLTHNTTFTLSVTPAADFSISLTAGTLTLAAGGSTTNTVTITSLGGFSSAVNLSTGVLSPGIHISFSPPTVTPPASGTVTSAGTVSADPGSPAAMLTVTIIGASGNLTHSQLLDLTVTPASTPDFTLSANPTSISTTQGSSGTSTITIDSTNGFNSAVSLSYSWMGSAPSGLSISLPGPVTPPSGSSATSTLTVSADSTSSTGSFTLIVTGMSGSLTRSANVDVFVGAAATSIMPSSTTTSPAVPKCLIATATYGSELSPEVQLLRNFRDNSIQKTKSGSSFMLVFNTWYYSFSPYVASYLTANPAPRTAMKGVLYPIIGVLFLASNLFSATSAYPELAVLLSGLLASALIGALYVGLPLGLVRSKLRWRRNSISTRLLVITLLSGVAVLCIGEILSANFLLVVSSPMIVISTLLLAGHASSTVISEKLLNRKY
jgi:streptogramin lyase